jgi:hypothetical protein
MKLENNVECKNCKKKIINSKKTDKNEERFCNECLIDQLNYGNWSLSEEREFFENLYVGRFNYFIIVFSLFVTAGFANSFTKLKYLVFYFGAFLLILCWMPLLRAFRKFNLIITLLLNKRGHTLFILQKILKNGGFKSTLVISRWMGIYIPLICILFLFIMGLLINFGIM